MTALDHPLVQDYLHHLHAETARLGGPEGRELEAQIREHLHEALEPDPSEASVRQTLDRLGEPSDLVDAAAEGGPLPGDGPVAGAEAAYSPWREVGALLLLVGAALLFWLVPVNVALWLGGLVLLVLARRWTVGEKVLGGIVLGLGGLMPAGVAGALWVTNVQACEQTAGGAVVCEGNDTGGLNIAVLVALAAWLVVYVWTIVRLARSAARPR